MLQLGASDGKFITEYKKAGWDTIGYDFSELAVENLARKGVQARKIDLNARDEAGMLCYNEQLAQDIRTPTNILLIRILQYLELPALKLILFSIIENSSPESIFFIAGRADRKNYKASFFGCTNRYGYFNKQRCLS